MEHRCGNRASLEIVVAISGHGLETLTGRVRDLGLGGMFVDLGRGTLPLNSPVHLTFDLDAPGAGHPCEAEGVVVHQEPCGCGVMFTALDSDAFEAVRSIVCPTRPGSFTAFH